MMKFAIARRCDAGPFEVPAVGSDADIFSPAPFARCGGSGLAPAAPRPRGAISSATKFAASRRRAAELGGPRREP